MKLVHILFITVLLASCRSAEETVSVRNTATAAVRADTQRTLSAVRDTLLFHDSIYIKELQRGDTVFLTKNTVRLRYRDRWRTDTFYKASADTVRVTDYAWREKEAEKPWRLRTALTATGTAAAALAIATGLFLIMLRRKG